MKEFLKDNIALVAAIALPLLLAVIFGLSTLLVSANVEDPKNDFLVVTNYDAYNTGYQFEIINDKLTVSFKEAQKDSQGNLMPYTGSPRFWRVHVPEMTVEEITLRNPNGNKSTASIDIPGATDITVRNISPGPDGYEFINSYNGGGGNLMTEMFSGRSYNDRMTMAIAKSGRYVAVKIPGTDYYAYNTRFIGWVVE
jgi:hypothetical protein